MKKLCHSFRDGNGSKLEKAEPEKKLKHQKDAVNERAEWSHPIQFLLSVIGYAVGLGNIWRFPYVVMDNGGGAFLIPFIIYIFLCGIPMCYMEFTLGQYTGLSPVQAFNFAPIFKGVGWAMLAVSGVVTAYYGIFMTWILYYLAMSFQWDLPWKSCNNSWNTDKCISFTNIIGSMNASHIKINKTTSSEEFWLHNTLEISDDISQLGGINWKLLLCSAAIWIIIFLCLIKGIKSSGKVVYVTVTVPFIFLTIILIRGCTLPGSWIGLKFYLRPDWEKLFEMNLWTTAAIQVFYCLGPAWGGLITMASYNKYHHRYNRDAIILPLVCCGTSIYGGLAIFSVIGNMMYDLGITDIYSVMQNGPGVIFVVYPEALSRLPGACIWTALFFLMLLALGLDTQFSTLETVTSGFIDKFPSILGRHKTLFTFAVCLGQLLLSLILVTRAGSYYFQVFDWYATPTSIMIIALLEVISISYVHGATTLFKNSEMCLGHRYKISRIIWLCSWYLIAPGFILAIMISIFIDYTPPAFTNGKRFPEWSITMGWMIASVSLIPLPLLAGAEIWNHRHHLIGLFHPCEHWKQVVAERQEKAKRSKNETLNLTPSIILTEESQSSL